MLVFMNMETVFIFGILFVYVAFVSMRVHKCVGIHVSADIHAIVCAYAWACLWQSEVVTWCLLLSPSTLYFEEDSWLNSDPLDFTSSTHHHVPNRIPPECWDYRLASIPAYYLCEGWRPECQTSCIDAKHFISWDILQPFLGIVCMNFVYFLINILCTF